MKNGLFFAILLLLAVSSFAQDIKNRYLFIEGTASRSDHADFFRSNFAMEASGAGYVITSTKREALHTLKFSVVSDSSDPDYEQYVVTISLYRNEDEAQLITFDFVYSDLSELYTFSRTLFLNAVANIPLPISEEATQWNKWIYFRASFNYPITLYELLPEGMVGKYGLTNADKSIVTQIGHEITAMPGATLGVEFQRFNFLSLEVNAQLNMEKLWDSYDLINSALGLELKFPVKLKNVMLIPYGTFLYTFNVSLISSDFQLFDYFPPYAAGGGAQLCARAGKRGVVFLDAKYTFSFQGDAVMRNPYLAVSPQIPELPTIPRQIHYKRSQVGIGVGYKFGILDRK